MHIQQVAKIVTETIGFSRAKVETLLSLEEQMQLPEPAVNLLKEIHKDLEAAAKVLFG